MESNHNLGQRVGRGLGYALINQLITRVAIFTSGIILAHLLSPNDFGQYAVAFAAMNLLITINEWGVIPSLIRAGNPREIAPTGRSLALIASCSIYGLAFIAAPFFASALGAPSATGLLRVLALTILIDGAVAVPLAALNREFLQDRQMTAELSGLAVYLAVALGLAAGGAGPWSIVWARLLGAIAAGALMLVLTPMRRVRFGFQRRIARDMLLYGTPLAIASLLRELVLNVDYIVVGSILGSVTLGVYLLAFNLSSLPANLVSVAVNKVAFAGYARLAHDSERSIAAFRNSLSLLVTAVAPLVVAIALFAPEIVNVVYGAKWFDATTPLRFLVFLGGMRVFIDHASDYIAAHGHSRRILAIRVAWLVALVPALVIGANGAGIAGVGAAHLIVAAVVVLPLVAMYLHDLGIAASELVTPFVRPAIGVVALLISGQLVREIAPNNLTTLVFGGAAAIAAYALLVVPGNPLLHQYLNWRKQATVETEAPAKII